LHKRECSSQRRRSVCVGFFPWTPAFIIAPLSDRPLAADRRARLAGSERARKRSAAQIVEEDPQRIIHTSNLESRGQCRVAFPLLVQLFNAAAAKTKNAENVTLYPCPSYQIEVALFFIYYKDCCI
jgi:hypothetical protein